MNKRSEIGYIQKAHGLKGEVFLKTFDADVAYLSKGLELFLDSAAYQISTFRKVTGGVIVKFSNVDDRNSSDLLKGKSVSVDSKLFADLSEGDDFYLNQLKGFQVILNGKSMGEVSGFASTEAHDLLRIVTSEGEVELPYVDFFISEIRHLDKEIHVDCPVELFDVSFFSGGAKK